MAEGVKSIRLIPLDENGNPLSDALSVPVRTFDFTDINQGADDTLGDLSTAVTEWKMELKDVDVAALYAFFAPEPQQDDRVTVEYDGHTVLGHLEYVGEVIIDGKVKQQYDMHDGVFTCGPHDEEGNHIG